MMNKFILNTHDYIYIENWHFDCVVAIYYLSFLDNEVDREHNSPTLIYSTHILYSICYTCVC